ncbi:MAG: ribonuclease III, partial [Pseudomonadota bacterium]
MKDARPKRTRQRTRARPRSPTLDTDAVGSLTDALGHKFKDTSLLTRAMTHPSAVSHRREAVKGSYQRLEFLGDRVLGLVMAERLIQRYPTEREGDLAPRLNRLVNKGACARAAASLGIGKHVIMSPHEIEQGGRARESTLGDVCEAVIGALYIDGGLSIATRFIERAWAPQFEAARSRAKDPKTRLQEWTQARGGPPPHYAVLGRTGPDHAPVFRVRAEI